MTDTVWKYIQTTRPDLQKPSLGIGAFVAEFSDGTYTNSSWSVFTEVSGPSQESIRKGCSEYNPYVCKYTKNKAPPNWFSPSFIEDSSWRPAIEHNHTDINYGALPPLWIEGKGCCYSQSHMTYENLTINDGCNANPDVNNPAVGIAFHMEKHQCVNPWEHFAKEPKPGQPKFIWAEDNFQDYVNLFRFTNKIH